VEVWVEQREGWSAFISGNSYAQTIMFPTEVPHLTSEGIFPIALIHVFRLCEVDLEWVVMPSHRSKAGPVSSPPPLVHVIVVGGGGLYGRQREGEKHPLAVQA